MEEQTMLQQSGQTKSSKIIWAIIVSIAIISLVASGVIYFWKNSQLKNTRQISQQRIIALQNDLVSLQNELSQLQNDYKTLEGEKSKNIKPPSNNIPYNLVSDRCTTNECLFNTNKSDYPLGTAIIKGYYSPVKRSAWGETKKCDSFTITSGSKELIRAMINLVDSGNTVHSKNELNQPVINLGLELLNQSEKQNILKSTVNGQIELIVLMDNSIEAGVPACYRDVIVLRKK